MIYLTVLRTVQYSNKFLRATRPVQHRTGQDRRCASHVRIGWLSANMCAVNIINIHIYLSPPMQLFNGLRRACHPSIANSKQTWHRGTPLKLNGGRQDVHCQLKQSRIPGSNR